MVNFSPGKTRGRESIMVRPGSRSAVARQRHESQRLFFFFFELELQRLDCTQLWPKLSHRSAARLPHKTSDGSQSFPCAVHCRIHSARRCAIDTRPDLISKLFDGGHGHVRPHGGHCTLPLRVPRRRFRVWHKTGVRVVVDDGSCSSACLRLL